MRARQILLVADRTAAEPHVIAAITERAAGAPFAVTLLVPASRPRGGWTWDETSVRLEARRRMQAAVSDLRRAGIPVTGMLGDISPIDAIRDEMRRAPHDEIMISTLPRRSSRWLRTDLPTRAAREFDVPVTHVETDAEPEDLNLALDRPSSAA
jgi:hypothetical protein